MFKKKLASGLVIESLRYSLAVAAYIFSVALFLFNAETIFQGRPEYIIAVTMLTLLVLSAATVGSLIFGRPLYLYFDNQKKEAVKFLGLNLMWLLIFVVILLIVLLIS